MYQYHLYHSVLKKKKKKRKLTVDSVPADRRCFQTFSFMFVWGLSEHQIFLFAVCFLQGFGIVAHHNQICWVRERNGLSVVLVSKLLRIRLKD